MDRINASIFFLGGGGFMRKFDNQSVDGATVRMSAYT